MLFVSHFRQLSSLGVGLLLCAPSIVVAYTPESPEVRTMVQRGVQYMGEHYAHYAGAAREERLAELCVCGLACYASRRDVDHPVVSKAIAAIRAAMQVEQIDDALNVDDLGHALIFVSSIDAVMYWGEVEWLQKELYRRQRADGAWGEPEPLSTDFRTTENVCFGMWIAHRSGIKVREPSIMRTVNWLLDRQRGDRSFDVASVAEKSPGQTLSDLRSRTAAALTCLYLCGDILGWLHDPPTMRRRDGYPIAVDPVVAARTCLADEMQWQRALNRGNDWLANGEREDSQSARNPLAFDGDIQAFDRYFAIHDRFGYASQSSNWYDDGVDLLRENQLPNGSWELDGNPVLTTARCVSFLLRQSARTVLTIENSRRRERSGSEQLTEEQRSAILKWLENGDRLADLSFLEDDREVRPLILSDHPVERRQQLIRLRRMVVKGNCAARSAAAVTLGTVRDFDSVPALIEALADPEVRVIVAARDALRFMSRKPDGSALEVVGGRRPSIATLEAAQAHWREWLRSVKPELLGENQRDIHLSR